MPRREPLSVVGVERIGAYALLRLARGRIDPGTPGQFFMLEAPGRVLPRPLSLCLAPPGELHFLIDPVGPGTAALCALRRGDAIHVYGPLGNGFDLDVARPLLVGGGIGMAPLPYLAEALRCPPTILGFRSELHAEAARLMPGAEVVIDPVLVTDVLPDGYDVLACGPEPMLHAMPAGAQLAWEAPMACGYGACYGCAVEIGGELKRLCVEGPVLRAAHLRTDEGLSPASALRVAASSVASLGTPTNAPCVLAPLGARDRDTNHRPQAGRGAAA